MAGGPRGGFRLVTTGRTIEAEKVILATGGQSYPACGTTGDGYRWAAALGHRIVPPRPALVPVTSHAPWVLALQGVTLPDVMVRVVEHGGARLPARRRIRLLRANAWRRAGKQCHRRRCLAEQPRGDALRPFRRDRPGRDGRQPRGERFRGAQCAGAALRSPAGREGERVGGPAGQRRRRGGQAAGGSLMQPWLPRRVAETLLALSDAARPAGRPSSRKSSAAGWRRPSSGSTSPSAAQWASARPS